MTPTPASTRPGRVETLEVGPRDGLQNEDRTLPVETRVAMIGRLVDAGVRRLEAVSFVRPDRVPQMAGAEEVMSALPERDDVTYVGLVLNARGAERARETACTEVNLVLPVTDTFSERNQGAPTAAILDQCGSAAEVARAAGMTVSVTLAVSFGCPFEGEVPTDRVAEVLDGVLALAPDEVAFADTVGVGVPSQVRALGALLPVDGPRLRFHFHNTRNTGYANAWTAAGLAAEQGRDVVLDASVGGFGGCPFAPAATGNIATEDLLYLLRRGDVPLLGPEIDLPALEGIGSWVSGELDSPVQGLLGKAGGFGGVG